jgi:ATP-dependent protease ClpP protease subunit
MSNNAGILIEDEFNEKSCTSYVAHARDIVAQGAGRVRFDIASWGGDINAARKMYEALTDAKILFDTRAILTSSAASYFFLMGARRQILPTATISFHGVGFLIMPPDVDAGGTINAEKLQSWRELAKWCRQILTTKTKLDRQTVERILDSRANLVFNAEQALNAGIADEVVTRPKQ